MGGPFVVQRFARTFVRPVRDWQMRQSEWDPHSRLCIARCVVSDGLPGLPLTAYADDLCKTAVLSSPSVAALESCAVASNQRLDESLGPYADAQNKATMVVAPRLLGCGSRHARWDLRDGKASRMEGVIVDSALYLGSRGAASNHGEVQRGRPLRGMRSSRCAVLVRSWRPGQFGPSSFALLWPSCSAMPRWRIWTRLVMALAA